MNQIPSATPIIQDAIKIIRKKEMLYYKFEREKEKLYKKVEQQFATEMILNCCFKSAVIFLTTKFKKKPKYSKRFQTPGHIERFCTHQACIHTRNKLKVYLCSKLEQIKIAERNTLLAKYTNRIDVINAEYQHFPSRAEYQDEENIWFESGRRIPKDFYRRIMNLKIIWGNCYSSDPTFVFLGPDICNPPFLPEPLWFHEEVHIKSRLNFLKMCNEQLKYNSVGTFFS